MVSFYLFIVDILFSNHFIKLFEFIKPIRVSDQNIKYYFFIFENIYIILIFFLH